MEARVIKTAQQRAESDGWQVSMEQYRREEIADLRAALASAQEEIAGLRKDAERYRYLREPIDTDDVYPGNGQCWVVQYHHPLGAIPELRSAGFAEKLDATLDLAISEAQP